MPRRFAALRNRDCRPYLLGSMFSMMADNIEHVITYWVLWEVFRSPALAGFAVISHWVPFLFSFWFGALADRHDCRRIIQLGQALFMGVSIGWGVLFVTDSLELWNACVLLVLHGVAGALWSPASQLMLHDFVPRTELPSAVRLYATFRNLGILAGPVVGSALLIGLGPSTGIFVNVLFYLPLTVFLFRTKFTGHLRDGGSSRPRLSLVDAVRVLGEIRSNPDLVSMIAVAGLGSFFVGAALLPAMPVFAEALAPGDPHRIYGALLFVNGLGGVAGALLLEVFRGVGPTVRTAMVATFCYGLAIAAFAVTPWLGLASLLLFFGGVAKMLSLSVSQTVVQLLAPAEARGRVVGVYGVAANGLRAGSGVTVGLLGGLVGMQVSLAASAVAICIGVLVTQYYLVRAARRGDAGVAVE